MYKNAEANKTCSIWLTLYFGSLHYFH